MAMHILLGATGSSQPIKAVNLASKLVQQGTQVDVVLASATEKFIMPLIFIREARSPLT